MEQRTTDELLKILNSLDSVQKLDEFIRESQQDIRYTSLKDLLSYHMKETGITASELIREANIQRNYGYQILKGQKNPGRDKVLALCLTLKLTLDEVQRALTLAGEAVLYPKNRRDSILIFSIHRNLSVQDTNELLFEMDEQTL